MAMKLLERVQFQRPDTDACCEARIAWIAKDVAFLHVPTVNGDKVVRLEVEVARECEDGIFRRVENYKLDKASEDILRTLRELAESTNHT